MRKDAVTLLILSEGVDGAGKSHLAAAIRDWWPDIGSPASFQLIHTGPPNPPGRCVYQEYETQLDNRIDWVMSATHLLVLDRWHLGDMIYGPRYRGFARYTEAGLLHTEMALSSLGAVKVLCSPPLDVVQKRVADRGDDYIDQEDLPRIHAEYLAHAAHYGYKVVTGNEDAHIVASVLLELARQKAHAARQLAKASAGTYTGSLYPDCIIAGDELGGTLESRTDTRDFTRPFTPASPATSAGWLMSAVHKTGRFTTLGLVNANHSGVDVAAIARLRPAAGWVALGMKASKTLDGHGIWHNTVPHPAWARRFRSADFDAYAEQLRVAIHSESRLGGGR